VGGHPEPGGDLLDAQPGPVLVQPCERLELVGGVHVQPHHVLGQARLGPVHPVAVQHAAGDGSPLADALALGQQLQGCQPPPAGSDLVFAGSLALAVQGGPDHKGLQQPVRLDGGGQGLDAQPCPGAPGVGGGGDQLGKADLGGGVGNSAGVGHGGLPFGSGSSSAASLPVGETG